jgi:hypothetical protein
LSLGPVTWLASSIRNHRLPDSRFPLFSIPPVHHISLSLRSEASRTLSPWPPPPPPGGLHRCNRESDRPRSSLDSETLVPATTPPSKTGRPSSSAPRTTVTSPKSRVSSRDGHGDYGFYALWMIC